MASSIPMTQENTFRGDKVSTMAHSLAFQWKGHCDIRRDHIRLYNTQTDTAVVSGYFSTIIASKTENQLFQSVK